MANLPLTVNIDLQDLTTLLGYYWTSVNSKVGDLGGKSYEETVNAISKRSQVKITPTELEHLVYHMKQVVFEKLKPITVDLRINTFNKMMKNLASDIPQLFKEEPSGEIVFIKFEDREHDRPKSH